jgi:ABC-type uncharacterized transport system permease subunit
MWRIIILGALGIFVGTRARSERAVVLVSLLFGLLYGAAAVVSATLVLGPPSPSRVIYTVILGLVMAAPVYAIAEIWRRTRSRVVDWLRRLIRSVGKDASG